MKKTHQLAGKVALVTGASRGVGKGTATVLGSQGATVYVTGRQLSRIEETAAEAQSQAKAMQGLALRTFHYAS